MRGVHSLTPILTYAQEEIICESNYSEWRLLLIGKKKHKLILQSRSVRHVDSNLQHLTVPYQRQKGVSKIFCTGIALMHSLTWKGQRNVVAHFKWFKGSHVCNTWFLLVFHLWNVRHCCWWYQALLSICRARKTSIPSTEMETLLVNMFISALQGTALLYARVWLITRGGWMFGQNLLKRVDGCANHADHLWMRAEQEMGDTRTAHELRLEDSTKSKASSGKDQCMQYLQPGKAQNKCGRQ